LTGTRYGRQAVGFLAAAQADAAQERGELFPRTEAVSF